MYVGKTKALISFAVTAKLICVFVFAYAKSRFSHDVAHIEGQPGAVARSVGIHFVSKGPEIDPHIWHILS